MTSVFSTVLPRADIHVEYQDAKRFNPESTGQTLAALLAEKYGKHKPDIMLVSDDAAFDFMLGLQNGLFAGVPMIFCGVNDFIPSRIAGRTGVTGVAEATDIAATVNLALSLHPKAKALAVITDSTETGATNLLRFRKIIPLLARNVAIRELTNLSVTELVAALKEQGPETVILNLSFFRDRLGKSFSPEEGNRLIARNADNPVYSCWDFYLVGDVVGGLVVSGRLQGEEAARMAVRVLSGESVDSIPVVMESPNVPMFDFQQMRRFGVSVDALPENAVVLNSPVSFYERYKALVWASLMVTVALAALVVILCVVLANRMKAEQRLRESQKFLADSEARYRRLVDNVQDAIFLVDAEGKIIDTNRLSSERLGYTHEEFAQMWVWDVDIQVSADSFPLLVSTLLGNESVTVVGSHKCKDGTLVPVEVTVTAFAEGGQDFLLGVARDITDREAAEDAMRASEFKHRIIFENSPLGMVYVDKTGIVLDCNDKFVELIGVPKEQLIGCNPIREHSPMVAVKLQEALNGNQSIYEGMYTSSRGGRTLYLRVISNPVYVNSSLNGVIATFEDISARKRAEEALEKRMVALTRPLESAEPLAFDELFRLEDIQRLQDEFALATGVASIITMPDGTPITKPSQFCSLCQDIIRTTEKGLANCHRSDAFIGRLSSDGPIVRRCMSGGLWDAGAGISVGGQHVANWLIGQVRDEAQTEEGMCAYARQIGVDEERMIEAFRKVPSMSRKRFDQVAQVLYTLTKQLSDFAYQNVQQARFITEGKHSGELLRASELKHRVIFENSPLGMVYFNAEGTIVDCNDKFVDLMGASKEKLIGFSSINKSTPKMQEALRTALHGAPSVYEDPYTSVNGGKSLYLRVIFNPVNYGVSPTEVIATLEDITESKQLLELMVQNEKMISVGGLAAGMAHEINNPLGGILQGVQNLQRRLSSETPANVQDAEAAGCSLESVREYCRLRRVDRMLEGIRECGQRAAEIVANMLNFSRKSERNTVMASLVDLAERAIALTESDYDLLRRYDSRKIQIVRDFEPDLPLVECSETEIVQVFFNIIRNGTQALFQHSRDGETGQITITIRNNTDHLVVWIADNGPGMSNEVARRIFDPFFTTKPPGEGTGLGLSVTYLIVTRNHGGEISVESSPGNGTTFIIRLPLHGAALPLQ